jgi:alanine-synthesizing transaminase
VFEYLATMDSVCVEQYPLHYHAGWSMDVDAMPVAARAIVLVNPNNPDRIVRKARRAGPAGETGRAADFRRGVCRLCIRAGSRSGDDSGGRGRVSGVFHERPLEDRRPAADETGMDRSERPEPQRREALEKLEWIADTYLSVSAPVQCAAERLLRAGERCSARFASAQRRI